MRSGTKAPAAGVLALDPRWSKYAEYMEKMMKSVQTNWYAILRESNVVPAIGTRVTVTLKLKADGQVFVLKVEETAGKPATYACIDAIQNGQPYRKWTEEMIRVLGSEQTMTFTFAYE